MLQTGDSVIYGIHGVCCVAGREAVREGGNTRFFLVLEPLGQSGSRYLVPEENPAAMAKLHRVLTAEALDALLSNTVGLPEDWIADEGRRKQEYRSLIGSGDRVRLVRMLRALYAHREAMGAAGRKVHQCDENFLRDAEKLLAGEIAYVRNLEDREARAYLRRMLME